MQEFRFLYLETINPVGDDEIGNIILDTNGNKIAFHSWYARAYEVYEDQTTRINIFLQDFNIENSSVDFKSIKIIRKPFFNWKKRFTAFIKPLRQN